MNGVCVIGDETIISQGVDPNNSNLTMAQQTPESRDRIGGKEYGECEGDIQAFHLCKVWLWNFEALHPSQLRK